MSRLAPCFLRDGSSGIALILVIWILVILIAIVGAFSYSMRSEIQITTNFKEEEEAYQLALAGIESAKLEILSAKESSYVYVNEEGMLIFGEAEAEENEAPLREAELDTGNFTYTMTDEDGKLNINTASLAQIKYIVESSGVDITDVDTIADSIADWRDPNDLHMLNGAEEDYYRSLPRPYSCKDGPFDAISELLLVKGVTPEIYSGGPDEKDGEESYKGLVNYLTPWSSKTVNINTAPVEVLEAVFGIDAAQNIIAQRESGPILSAVTGGSIMSSYFTVISTGSSRDGTITRTIKAAIKKSGEKYEVIYWNDNFIG